VSFYIHTDAYTDVNVGMGIGILIPEAMISKSTIEKLASVDDKEILTVSDLVQETFEYLVQFQMAQRDSRPNIRIYYECRAQKLGLAFV
jgi:hypothetical protein